MIKTWRPRISENKVEIDHPSALLRQLLAGRNLNNQDEAERFLNPNYERDLHDPFLMKDMDRAVERILKAIKGEEKIAIYADYDADGVPGATVIASFFNQIGFKNFLVYIPDRHMEAYGLNDLALGALAAKGVKLVITVDCGVSDVGPVAEANRLGLEVIITDHHLAPDVLPEAHAIVNPKRVDDEYPYKMLAGAGVAFKLVQALLTQLKNFRGFTHLLVGSDADENSSVASVKSPSISLDQTRDGSLGASRLTAGWEKWLLDLVAIATVSDMVPLTGENRALVHFGLKVLRRTPRPGLRALAQVLRLDLPFITEDDIGFMIGPRLNSASRMSHGDEAYALLTATDEAEARHLAYHLESKNKERRAAVTQILEAAGEGSDGHSVLVLGDPAWSLGVLGLAASRLVEERRQPVFLWGKNGNGTLKGSCRSDGTVNIVELMKLAGNIFANYGGHAQAGGFSIEPKNLPKLAPSLHAAYAKLEKLPTSNGDLFYDLELPWEIISHDTHSVLDRLSPFGVDNHKPVFYFPKLSLAGKKFFGNGTKHLELTFPHADLGLVKAIKFFAPDVLPKSSTIDLLATLEKSYFRNRPELRLRIIDWREAV